MKKHARKTRRSLISVSPFTVVCAVVLIVLGQGAALLSYVAVLLVHEFAHAFAAERLGYTLRTVRIMPYGVSIDGDFEGLNGRDEAVIAAAGPLVNLLGWIVLVGLWWLFPETYIATQFLADASLFTAVVNLIPVYPLDGGRILHGLIVRKGGLARAHKVCTAIGWVVGIGVAAACAVALAFGANYTYATLAIFILSSLVLPGRGGKYENIYSMSNSEKRLKRGLRVRELMVEGNATLLSLYRMLRADCYTKFVIADSQMREIAVVTETELTCCLAHFNSSEKVISVARPRKK